MRKKELKERGVNGSCKKGLNPMAEINVQLKSVQLSL